MNAKVRAKRPTARLLHHVLLLSLLLPVLVTAGCGPKYELLGSTWVSVDPLYYRIDSSAGTLTVQAFSDAVDDWNETSTPVSFVSHSDNYVVLLDEADNERVRWDGLCVLTITADETTIIFAHAWLNVHYTKNYAPRARRSVAGHELGHALGLDDFDGEVLMHGETSVRFFEYGICSPQEGDAEGVNAMYG